MLERWLFVACSAVATSACGLMPGPTMMASPDCAGAGIADVGSMTFHEAGADSAILPAFESAGAVSIRVVPAAGSHTLTRAQLAEGRIVARVTTSGAYGPINVPAGTSYWWVRVNDRPSQAYIPAGGGTPICQPLIVKALEPDMTHSAPIAAVVGPVPWMACGRICCCGMAAAGCTELRHNSLEAMNGGAPPVFHEPTLTLEQMFAPPPE